MIIPARFNGPPGTGNGGYTAGLLAAALGPGAVEVTLRRPPPLDTPLTLRHAGGTLSAHDGDDLIATARTAEAVFEDVPGVSFEEAVAASAGYPGFTAHPFPTCYVCGPDRTDGMALYPGVLPDGRTATPWRVPAGVAAPDVWAALDCPGGWAVLTQGRPYVLGRMTAVVGSVPAEGERCVVTGLHVGGEGRRATVLSTLRGSGGRPLARALATWVALPAA